MTRIKYPRTPHLPWSPGASLDDTRMADVRTFEGQEIVVTEKLDGENTTLSRDGLHARSLGPRPHPSRDWVKGLQGRIGYRIPGGWRLCGENLYARHSLAYEALEAYCRLGCRPCSEGLGSGSEALLARHPVAVPVQLMDG